MIRQLGCATIFLTLSAVETKWTELLVILMQMLENMKYEKKCQLIRNDPVTCVRYFEHRLKYLWEILSALCGLFEAYHELEDKYIRVEFQVRDSPRIHALFWLKNTGKYDKEKPETIQRCTEFINKFISVSSNPTEFSEDLINLQRHKHSHTCNKSHFGFPFFPMRKSTILEPFDDNKILSNEERKKIRQNKETVSKELDKISKDTNNSFSILMII